MKRIYLIGHGFMHKLTSFETFVDIITYVKEGKMYDAKHTEALVTKNYYCKSHAPRDVTRHHHARMKEHYFVSDMGSYKDVNQTQVWKSVGGHKARTMLPYGQGQLYNLQKNRFLFFTPRNKCVRLSVLIDIFNNYFKSNGDFEIHWSACRSFVDGKIHGDILEQMNSGDLITGIESIL